MELDTAGAGSTATDGPVPSFDRSKYKSPPPPPSSMTPPPSSQAGQNGHSHARTPTPTHSHLSSPPPTVKAAPVQSGLDIAPGLYTAEQIANATVEELRNMLNETSAAYREARASAAHHHLQYNLLRLESQEIMNRMGVELEMTQKEVEVLQTTTQRVHGGAFAALQPDGSSPATSSPDHVLANLRNACHLLEVENERLQRRLADAKTAILDREVTFAEENERLKERIRKNRQHLTLLRSSSVSQELVQDMVPSTPQPPRAGQGRRSGHYMSTPGTGRDKNSDALLLAASQEAATTPSTPTPREPRAHRQQGHTRATHSLSSLPATPSKAQTRGYGPYYVEPGAERATSGKSTRPVSQSSRVLNPELNRRRRESRDSTISASDVDDRQDVADLSGTEAESDEEVPASQASQEAVTLLRKSASFRQPTAPNSAQTSYSSAAAAKSRDSLMQAKLPSYTVKKPDPRASSSKRKMRVDDFGVYDDTRSAKKAKRGDGIGLGIGWPLDER